MSRLSRNMFCKCPCRKCAILKGDFSNNTDGVTPTSINFPYLTLVGVLTLRKTAGVVKNSGHCVHSVGLNCL